MAEPTKAAEFDYDVFISYSSHDQEWVHGELLRSIEKTGLRAFIDFRDFTRGAPSVNEMERGVDRCAKTLLVLTPAYIESEWCEFEALLAQTLGPANRDLRLLPLLKAECEKPKRLGIFTHIDFTPKADQALAWRQLLTALGRPPEPEAPKAPASPGWFLAHPYPMPPHFTGRVAEREMLTRWLNSDPSHRLLSLRALGGFGKSALAWHWLTHDVPAKAWPRVAWWSFYEGDARFEHFLDETLNYLSNGKLEAGKLGPKQVLDKLLRQLEQPGTLLVLDGFERVLRAFGGLDAAYRGDDPEEPARPTASPGGPAGPSAAPGNGANGANGADRDCLSPLTEAFLYNLALQPAIRSKILLTTRLCPRLLEAKGGGLWDGCREVELNRMDPADAVGFFQAQGIRGTRVEIEAACEPYGYHPLSLRLLAGLIVKGLRQPGDVAAAKRLDVSGDLIQRRHHVLEAAYEGLSPSRRALLGRIGCFRAPVSFDTLLALAKTEATPAERPAKPPAGSADAKAGSSSPAADAPLSPEATAALEADLQDLLARGLLHHDREHAKFDLHPIVRRYAYDRLTTPDRAAAHARLRDYFAAVPKAMKVTCLDDLAPTIELYHHTVRAGQYDEACDLFNERLNQPLYFQLGAYPLIIDLLSALFPDGEERPPRLKDERAQGRTLNALANSCSRSGQPRRAIPLFERHNKIREAQGDKVNLAIGLGNVAAGCQIPVGSFRAAEANLRRHIDLCREIKDERNEATGHRKLGRLLAYRAAWAEAKTEFAATLRTHKKQSNVQGQGLVWAYRAQAALLAWRESRLSSERGPAAAEPAFDLRSARRALELAEERARTQRPNARDFVQAHWLLGASHRVAGQWTEAERHLHQALERCRQINLVDLEADILIDLARLRAATGQAAEAERLANEALVIADRCGYVLQGADAHLELARLALARADRPAALAHAQAAQRLATCDGPPDYTYKVAYAEAAALLAELNSSGGK